MKAEFTEELRSFLKQEGYTHVYNRGVRPGDDDYVVEPLKPEDIRLTYDDTNMHIEKIDEDEVKEIAHGVDLIVFMALVDTELFEKYAKL